MKLLCSFAVGTGNCFEHGIIAPTGLGMGGSDKDFILSVDEVTLGLAGLQAAYPDKVKLPRPPFKTYEGRWMQGAVVRVEDGSGDNGILGPRAFIMSGISRMEEFLVLDVEDALTAGTVILPLANPDGVAYDQTTGTCWCKNRRPLSQLRGSTGLQGGLQSGRALVQDGDFGRLVSEIYHGKPAESEPETRAVKWILASFNETLSWMADLHSYGGKVLYAWGDNNAGRQDPEQTLSNPEYDRQRGFMGTDPVDSRYKEHI
ncbi:Zn pept [Geosmithia morbida]|uniref:Zn pept n=1 Tax=Geosmithia morbida TaxID=1094350 RepID=A0A9P5D2K3_9HYPO|nr:Zn pept [Geosmithia morbida]KAF4120905.1 Zn pept [Geosmithia morbida]